MLKRKAPTAPEAGPPKRPCVSKRYPGLRAPPQRRLKPKAFSQIPKVGSSHFEKLAPEIRNQIYEMVLVDKDNPLNVRHKQSSDREATNHALLHVSRSIRVECSQMYYSSNTFIFRSLQDLELFLATISPDCRFVRKVGLAEGVVEGRHYPYGTREESRKPRTRTRRAFTYCISKGTAPVFKCKDDNIHPLMRTMALEKLGKIGKLMSQSVEQDLVIEGMIAHCPQCATGSRWDCGLDRWWRLHLEE